MPKSPVTIPKRLVTFIRNTHYKDPDAKKLATGGDSTAAIMATPTGLNVRLDASLAVREAQSGSRGNTKPRVNPSTSRRAASLLAFLQTLWSEAGLNQWTGASASRHWGQCNAMLLAEAGTARINGADAQKVLHIMRRYEEADRSAINAEFDWFLDGLVTTKTVTQRGLVIGEIGEVAATQYGHALTLRQSARKYYASTTQIEQISRSHAHAWRALGSTGSRVVAILLVERTAKGHLKLIDLAAMLCSSAFIPCDSIHEVAMTNRLVSERRDFVKPIRMAPDDDMLPDFILRDTSPRTHVEVYGMNLVPAYEARKKKEKRALRLARGIPALEWNIDREALDSLRLPPVVDAAATT
ncbi:DUF1173 family protein [Paraburkholderia gardini]|uniref:DUF1173 family protein n=1 Tax=Paraburkholderia gardini TaxID=2823469 RepID=UPI001E34A8D6|nr:DUF1173 family protein [Paraburkholderia gardini]